MSVAVHIETGGAPPGGESAAGTVAVGTFGFAHCAAACTCGWHGRRRYLKAMAVQDAWTHSIHRHCAVASPLVLPAPACRGQSARISRSIVGSMLPPESTITVRPAGVTPRR